MRARSRLVRKFHHIGNDNALVGSCEATNIPPAVARKKAGILDSGLVDHEMVAGVRFELTTFGL